MVKLFGVVVGVGKVFSVDIDISETVGDLKDTIKHEMPGLVCFDADLLKLYLAREGDVWLNSRDAEIKARTVKTVPERVYKLMQEHQLLDPTRNLSNDAYFGKFFKREKGDIHVLVECPDELEQGVEHILPESDGSGGSFVGSWLSYSLRWLFRVEKEKRA